MISRETAEIFAALEQPSGLSEKTTVTRPYPAKIGEDAKIGLAWDFVGLMGPCSESDDAALLTQFLTCFGSAVGHGPYFQAEDDRHHMNLYMVLIGVTSRGRKGTGFNRVRRFFETSDPSWTDKVEGGLSTGEGVVWRVRDRIEKTKSKDGVQEIVIEDEGISDKRLLCIEAEFASPLQMMTRQGNSLSMLLRTGWDRGDIGFMTKNNRVKATGAHISIIGHITADELLRHLSTDSAANGFANRILWVCSRRSKLLPEGGSPPQAAIDQLRYQVGDAIREGRERGLLVRDEEARRLWHDIYMELAEGPAGLLGCLTARGEPYIMRLACLYALLDRSPVVTAAHLRAAKAVWDYCAASVAFVFGDALGDPTADTILSALRASTSGLTRTEISGIFGRNVPSQEIGRALTTLANRSMAQFHKDTTTGGKAAEVWSAMTTKTLISSISLNS